MEQEKFLSFSSTLYPMLSFPVVVAAVVSFICDLKVRQGDGNPSSLFVDEKLRSPRQVNNKSHVLSHASPLQHQSIEECQDKVENHLSSNKQIIQPCKAHFLALRTPPGEPEILMIKSLLGRKRKRERCTMHQNNSKSLILQGCKRMRHFC